MTNDEKPKAPFLWTMGIFLLKILNIILVTICSTWIFVTFWGWFILGVVPGAPALSMAAAFGINFIFGYLRINLNDVKLLQFLDENTDPVMKEVQRWLGDWLLNGFCLATGAIWHFWLIPLFGW